MGAYSKRLRSAQSSEQPEQHCRYAHYRCGLMPRHACWHTSPSSRNNIVVTLITDVVLCLVMLVGILRLRQHGTLLGLGQLLWRQVSSCVSYPL